MGERYAPYQHLDNDWTCASLRTSHTDTSPSVTSGNIPLLLAYNWVSACVFQTWFCVAYTDNNHRTVHQCLSRCHKLKSNIKMAKLPKVSVYVSPLVLAYADVYRWSVGESPSNWPRSQVKSSWPAGYYQRRLACPFWQMRDEAKWRAICLRLFAIVSRALAQTLDTAISCSLHYPIPLLSWDGATRRLLCIARRESQRTLRNAADKTENGLHLSI